MDNLTMCNYQNGTDLSAEGAIHHSPAATPWVKVNTFRISPERAI
jgi:hypothetical protein